MVKRAEEERAKRLAAIQAKISARDPGDAAKAVAGRKVPPSGTFIMLGWQRITLTAGTITAGKHAYPVKGARAEVSDFRSGLVGRKHTVDLIITLASGEVLTWHQTDTGTLARLTHNRAVKFAAAVNSAAAR